MAPSVLECYRGRTVSAIGRSQRSGYRRRAEAPSFIAYANGQALSVTGQGNGGPVGVSLFGNIHQQFPSALEE